VIVQNLTKGTSITVPSENVLNLVDVSTVVETLSATDGTIRVYPASVDGKYKVLFYARQAGITQLNALSIDGRKVAGISINLQTGSNAFELSLPKGAYVIQVTGNGYAYTAKMLNQTGTQKSPGIVYTGTAKPALSSPQKSKSSSTGKTTMLYNTGDRLLYKGISGIYSTIVTDVPTGSKTTNFEFAACTDADGNNYTVVNIGPQTWMAENLKTTQFNAPYNGTTAIQLVESTLTWGTMTTPGYCWYNNDISAKNTIGALYNWYTVNTGKLAPTGWHVPSDGEWVSLENYLITNGYNYDGSTTLDYLAKSLASNTSWSSDTGAGSTGNDLSKNNSTGFSALPGGFRVIYSGFIVFISAGDYGVWESSNEDNTGNAIYWGIGYNGNYLKRVGYNKSCGASIRCVMNK
jgi:uncharacterized protein (TIGR02145 family)